MHVATISRCVITVRACALSQRPTRRDEFTSAAVDVKPNIRVVHPGNPAIVAAAAQPLDRWLCVPAFRRVCPLQCATAMEYAESTDKRSSGCASHTGVIQLMSDRLKPLDGGPGPAVRATSNGASQATVELADAGPRRAPRPRKRACRFSELSRRHAGRAGRLRGLVPADPLRPADSCWNALHAAGETQFTKVKVRVGGRSGER